jgi:hypothetical protein
MGSHLCLQHMPHLMYELWYMFTLSIEIFALENHGMALVYLHFIDWTLWRILDWNNDQKGFLCYVFLCKNLKELGVLWVWSKNLFKWKRGHERLVRKEPYEKVSYTSVACAVAPSVGPCYNSEWNHIWQCLQGISHFDESSMKQNHTGIEW